MFIGALNPTPTVTRRLQEWVDELWPGHRSLGSETDVRLWTTADLGVLSEHRLDTERLAVAIEGWVWHNPGDGAGEVEWGPLDRLAELVRSSEGWPLPRDWDGSFACCVYDKKNRILSLAVDPVGLRRLFFGRSGDTLVFGNTQAACAYALGLEPDLSRVAQWFALGHIPGSGTLFNGLTEVMVGERRRFLGDGSDLDSVTDMPWHDAMETVAPGAAAEAMVPLLRQYALRFAERLRPGQGALALSGGMDSRLVLGALGEHAEGFRTYTYGAAGDHEVELALKSARAAGAEPRFVDLTGRYFPDEQTLRRRVLLAEAISFPFWHYVDEAAAEDGVETLLLGDITNCMNVYIKPLRGRDERVQRAIRRLTFREQRLDENPTSPEQWLEGEITRSTRAAKGMAERLGLGIDPQQLSADVSAGFEELYRHLSASEQSLFCLQEKFYLAIERQESGGSQIVSLNGTRQIIPIFSTRRIVAQGFNVGFASRTRRAMLDAVARRILPPSIRRLPTATIPFVSVSAPKWSQEGMWFLRWLADASLRSASRRWPNSWHRDRLFKTIALKPEYQRAVALGYGAPYAVSGAASTEYWARRIRRTASGERPPTVPISEMRALSADTSIAAAIYGPGYLNRLTELPRS